MTFLYPNALFLGLLALPILLLYMLRLRRREVVVSSNFLWAQVLNERQANTPWQRLKRNVLLFLQLIILACMVLALSRPVMPVSTVASGSVVVLLDASASMNATDTLPSRFEAAKAYTHTLITNLSDEDSMTLILVGRQPVILASAEVDETRLQEALEIATVTQGISAWKEAFAIATGVNSSASNTSTPPTTIILSDGGLPDDQLSALPGEVRYVSFGSSGDNLAISALSIRATGTGAELFARLSNYNTTDRMVLLSIYRDGNLFHAEQVTIPADDHIALTLTDLPSKGADYYASISNPTEIDQPLDFLGLDDSANAVYQPTSPGRTLLVTPGNIFLEQVLAILPNLTPFRMVPENQESFSLPTDSFDLLVLDGVFPEDNMLPPGNLLLINPPSNPFFEVTGSYTVTANLRLTSDPLIEYIDASTIHIAQAAQIDLPKWGKPLLYTDQGILIFTGETSGRRIAVFSFDLHQSDLPLQLAFPILMAQLSSYLVPLQGIQNADSLLPGDSLTILPPVQANQVLVVAPDGYSYSLEPDGDNLHFTQTGDLGQYTVNYMFENDTATETFAVNLFSALESDIQPATSINIGSVLISASMRDELSYRQLWPWFAGAALAVLCQEWWLYHGRLQPKGKQRS